MTKEEYSDSQVESYASVKRERYTNELTNAGWVRSHYFDATGDTIKVVNVADVENTNQWNVKQYVLDELISVETIERLE